MTNAHVQGVVVDTMVISWLFDDRRNPLADRYRALIGSQSVLLEFHTVMELRFGALRAGWGELRRRRLERRIAELTVVQPDDETIAEYADLRLSCQQVGHAWATSSTTATDGSPPPRSASNSRSSPTTGSSTTHLGSNSSPPSTISSATTPTRIRSR